MEPPPHGLPEKSILSVDFLPNKHDLDLIPRKQQTDPDSGVCWKITGQKTTEGTRGDRGLSQMEGDVSEWDARLSSATEVIYHWDIL